MIAYLSTLGNMGQFMVVDQLGNSQYYTTDMVTAAVQDLATMPLSLRHSYVETGAVAARALAKDKLAMRDIFIDGTYTDQQLTNAQLQLLDLLETL